MLTQVKEDVALAKADRISIHVHFHGGKTTTLTIESPNPLTRFGKPFNWKGEHFTAKMVLLTQEPLRAPARARNAHAPENWQKDLAHRRKNHRKDGRI